MTGRTNGGRMRIARCKDGSRPAIFGIGWIDIPENDGERYRPAKHGFRNTSGTVRAELTMIEAGVRYEAQNSKRDPGEILPRIGGA